MLMPVQVSAVFVNADPDTDTVSAPLPDPPEFVSVNTWNVHGLVFPSPRSDSVWNSDNFRADVFAKAVRRAAAKAQPARRADLERLEFHDLRHTFASLMIAAGANPLQLAEALGHTDKTGRPDPTLVWKRYGHLYPGSTREAAAALDRHLKAVAS